MNYVRSGPLLTALLLLLHPPPVAWGAQLDSANVDANGYVFALAVQGDGKVLVGGTFTFLGGQARGSLGRLNADGSVDGSFDPIVNGTVYSVALQADGKILVGGSFALSGGNSRSCLARLNADGSLDTDFNPGADATVHSLVVQGDGSILVGGTFTTLAGQSRRYLGRLTSDGLLDPDFNPGVFGEAYRTWVNALAVQADGRILVGGSFTGIAGQNRTHLARLNPDGSLDTSFSCVTDYGVNVLAVQPNGKILVGGRYWRLGGLSRSCLGRLNVDGTVDLGFRADANEAVTSLAVLAGGRIVVGGQFTTLGGQSRRSIARLEDDGTLDMDFNFELSSRVNALAVEADGRMLVGGDYTPWGGQYQSSLLRFAAGGTVQTSLTVDTRTVTWQRADGGPEVCRTILDLSTDGTRWTGMGPGARMGDGWQWTALEIPTNASLRARGFTTGGYGNASGGQVEASFGPPALVEQPKSQTVALGGAAVLSVGAVGSSTLSYQWQQEGIEIAGATGPSYVLTDAQARDAGVYRAVVRNSLGEVRSADAALSVVYTNLVDAFNPVADGEVEAMAVQPDGKVLVGGRFTNVGGQPRSNLARLNADGTVDMNFSADTDDYVLSLAVQEDGKILVGGHFRTLGGVSRSRIGRLHPDGILDTCFNPGADSDVRSLALLPDGKVMVGGQFRTLGGQPRLALGRLNADGSLDSDFNPGADDTVLTLAVHEDGKIVVGGYFRTLGGQPRSHLGRLNADGTLDTSFNPGAFGDVHALAIQVDGKILVGGDFSQLGGQSRNGIGRLYSDGTLDVNFNPVAISEVFSLAIQANGKILVGGVGGWPSRSYLGRLHPDGTLDASFSPGAGRSYYSSLVLAVFGLAVQADGRILVGGSFNILGGHSRSYLGRITPAEPAIADLRLEGSNLVWQRGGSGPEVWRTILDVTTNGQDWSRQGAGTRGAGGWQWHGVTLSTGATARVRGFSLGAYQSASSGQVEASFGSPAMTLQPVSQSVVVSGAAALNVRALGSEPISYQWYKDGTPIRDATNAAFALEAVQTNDAGVYSATASNLFGSVHSAGALVSAVNASAPDDFSPSANGAAYALAVQPDGSILVGGYFTEWNGQSRNRIARLNRDGSLDPRFNPNADGRVASMTVQADGDILVAGDFDSLCGQPRRNLGRLNDDGSLDVNFNPGAEGSDVTALLLQADGRILVGGDFRTLAGQNQSNLGQLNPDGTLDTSFIADANGRVFSLAIQPDGKILVAGEFTVLAAHDRPFLGRLNADGTLDVTFQPEIDNAVYSLALQADGKILASGRFISLGGLDRKYLGRLNADGSPDADFNPVPSTWPDTIAIQTDGKILVGGNFTKLGRQTKKYLGRLNAVGTLDTSFQPETDGSVVSLAIQADGKILVSGWFSTLGGQSRSRIGRLTPTGPALQRLEFDGSTATWSRGGSSPEVWGTLFEGSVNAAEWMPLGMGSRIPGGWQLTGIAWPAHRSLRVHGYVASGHKSGSGWFVQNVHGPPVVVAPPASMRVQLGGSAVLEAVADGSPPLIYQWRHNGVDILDATNSTLTLSRATHLQAGNYSVVIRNAHGAVSSTKATVAVEEVLAWGAGTGVSNSPHHGQSIVPAGLEEVRAIAGGGYHSLAVRNDGTLLAWGAGVEDSGSPHYGQSSTPPGVEGIIAVSGGRHHTLALKDDGTVIAWGAGSNPTNDAPPHYGQAVVPPDLAGVLAVAAGDGHSAALTSEGRIRVWGSTNYGLATVPVTLTNAAAIASRGNHIVALREDGTMMHWGSWATLPVGVSNVLAIAAGVNHCLALKEDGTVVAWGSQTNVPNGLSNVVELAAGHDHSLALKSDGTVITWGDTHTLGRANVPEGLVSARRIACGDYHSLALLGDGSVLLKPQPGARNLVAGDRTILNALAVGAPPISYQWHLNGAPVPGAIHALLEVASVQNADAGQYSVTASNEFGSVTGLIAAITVVIPIDNALDSSHRVWSTSGSAAWFGQWVTTHDGVDAAQSGPITHSQQSSLHITVAGPGRVSFWWKTSSEQWFDFLTVYLGETVRANLSGDSEWQQQILTIPAGTHTVRWTYIKDDSVNVGADAGWLDQIVVHIDPPVVTLHPPSLTLPAGASVSFGVAAIGAPPLSYQWFRDGTQLAGCTSDTLSFMGVSRRDRGVYAVQVSNPGGSALSMNGVLQVLAPQHLGKAAMRPDGSFSLTSLDLEPPLTDMDLPAFEALASTNLVDWIPMSNALRITNGVLMLWDTGCSNHPARYYRLLEH